MQATNTTAAGTASTSACSPRALLSCQRPRPGVCRHRVAQVYASASGGPSSSSDGAGSDRAGKKQQNRLRAREPHLYEVRVSSPPPKSLGIYSLPTNTANGEEIEIDGAGYMVHRTVIQFKLRGGKYHRDHNRLDVQPTGRFFLNMMLEGLIRAKYMGPTGLQD